MKILWENENLITHNEKLKKKNKTIQKHIYNLYPSWNLKTELLREIFLQCILLPRTNV